MDHGVRFISLHDNIDTAESELGVDDAHCRTAARDGRADRAERVRTKADYTFVRGGMVMKVKYGYRKLSKEEAAGGKFGPAGLRIAKVDECTPVIREMRRRVMRGDSYILVAEWLGGETVPVGPYVTGGRWTARLVEDLLSDPILSGRKRFRTNVHRLVYGTGKHRCEPNPAGPDVREYPELAHLTIDEHSSLLAVIAARQIASKRVQKSGRESPMWNKPRGQSRWPGQHATCGICGGLMYQCGKFLRCRNTLPVSSRSCWNHVQVDIATVRAKVVGWVMGVLNRHPGFRDKLVDAAWDEFERRQKRGLRTRDALDQTIQEFEGQGARLAKAIATGGDMEALVAELAKVEAALTKVRRQQAKQQDPSGAGASFSSRDDVAGRLDDAMARLLVDSREVAELLRRLLPGFVIQPVQAYDCPQVRPCAKLTLRLDAWGDGAGPGLDETTTLDLFDPPVHIAHLAACVAAYRAGPRTTYKGVAEQLGIGHMTVKCAVSYHRLMEQVGATDPYREIYDKPERASRWKERPPSEVRRSA